MVFATFVGRMGAGKTALMTYWGLKDYVEKHRRIFANYKLKFPVRKPIARHVDEGLPCCPANGYKPEKLNLDWFIDPTNTQLYGATALMDEGWIFFDSRNSSSKVNRRASNTLLQTRKRGIDLYTTAQSFMQFDVRFRQNCDYLILCEKHGGICDWKLKNRWTGTETVHATKLSALFDLYDTNEIVDPMQLTANRPKPVDSDFAVGA